MAIVASLTYGAELLGVQLQSATLDQLRDAVKKSGALLIREGGENQWFDVYDSQNLLPGSTRMYLGYAKQSRQLAFVEYEFIGLQQPVMLSKLQIKYGNPKTQKGQYISDVRYRWRQDGIEIELAADWEKYRTRLSYINPLVLQDLKKEQAQAVVASSTDQQSRY